MAGSAEKLRQSGYSALSPVLSTNVVCVKTQQKHARIKHHDRTKQKLKNMIQWCVFLSVPKHYDPYSGNFVWHATLSHVLPTDYYPYSANLAGVHDRSHVPSQSFSKAVVLTIAVKVLGMLQHTNPLSLN